MPQLKDFDYGMIVGIGLGLGLGIIPMNTLTRAAAGAIFLAGGVYLLLRSKKV